ncbi:MAG: metallophosphoesterase [Candidatus Omnitrophica bacterium]|nr:metallophosphoesterase [Candidatus Omnitrophota bacterium]
MKIKTVISIILSLLFAAFLFYLIFIEPKSLEVNRLTLHLDNCPQGLRGTKMVHLSDFHTRRFGEFERRVIEIVNSENPDFIFITGDFVQSDSKDSLRDFFRVVSLLKSKEGIFAVLGNWEHVYGIVEDDLETRFLNSGATLLVNDSRRIKINGASLLIAGTDDAAKSNNLDLDATLAKKDKKDFVILLSHSQQLLYQDRLKRLEREKIELILMGHTHGGQVNIPLISDYIISKALGEICVKYKAGLFPIEGGFLYVNRGIGTSILPMRFLSRPEVAIITLEQKDITN